MVDVEGSPVQPSPRVPGDRGWLVEWRREPFERDGPYDGARDGLHPAAVGGVEDEPVALSLHGDAALVDGAMVVAAQRPRLLRCCQLVTILCLSMDRRTSLCVSRVLCRCVNLRASPARIGPARTPETHVAQPAHSHLA